MASWAPGIARREWVMARTVRNLLTLMLITSCLAAVVYAGQARKPVGQSPKAAGAVTFAGTVATPQSGMGATWGKGTLILNDGTQHAFEVEGLGVTGTEAAIVSVQAVGEVFNLKKLEDFEGTYKAARRDVQTGRAAEDISLTNERGVVVALTLRTDVTTRDVTFTPSATGVTVKLDK
jgi:hypothetical protein